MPRTKTIHAWIPDDSLRRTAFKKRLNGLLKKLNEISILCDSKVLAIVYGQRDGEFEAYPNLPEATMILQSFKKLPEMDQCKKMKNHETFLKEKLNKSLQQNQKLEKKIQEIHNCTILYEFMSGSDMNELDVQEARNVYQIAGSMQKIGYEWMMALMEKGVISSGGVIGVPALTNDDLDLDAAIASYIKELKMQDQNQILSLNCNHPNKQSVSNVNQEFLIEQPVISYVNDWLMHEQDGMRAHANQQLMIQKPGNNYVQKQKQKQKMVVPYTNDHTNVYQPMELNVHTNGSNMETGNQELADDDDFWNDLEPFGSL